MICPKCKMVMTVTDNNEFIQNCECDLRDSEIVY